MRVFRSFVVAAGLGAVLLACSTTPPSNEQMLQQAGFKAIPVKTSAQQTSFSSMTPHQLTRTTYKGKAVWVYPDRDYCNCLYVGNSAARKAYLNSAYSLLEGRAVDNSLQDDPYWPTAEVNSLDWDAWGDPEAYGLYVN
jgi:hypothetical protein